MAEAKSLMCDFCCAMLIHVCHHCSSLNNVMIVSIYNVHAYVKLHVIYFKIVRHSKQTFTDEK